MIAVTTIVPMAAESTNWMMYAGIAALGLGLLVLLVLAIPKERKLTTEERVVQYAARATGGLPAAGPVAPMRPEDSAFESAKSAAANVLKRNQSLEAKIAQRLEGAGSRWRPAEWLLFHSGIFLLLSVTVVVANLGADIIYGYLDPRVRV